MRAKTHLGTRSNKKTNKINASGADTGIVHDIWGNTMAFYVVAAYAAGYQQQLS